VNIGGSKHPLKDELKQSIAGCRTAEEVVEAVMQTLHGHRFIVYRSEDVLPILTPSGRVMVDLALHPDSTLRELSIRQGTTESNVTRQMTHLVEANLVQRTRSGKRNRYTLNLNEALNHPDIGVLLEAVIVSARNAE
jgi:predicted transcriptional regulator